MRVRPHKLSAPCASALPRVDGVTFCLRALAGIRRGVRAGRTPAVVLDIDNTLVDTRWRTLWAARCYGEAWGARHPLARLRLGQVRFTGRQTARHLGLDREEAEAFHRYWREHFWRAEGFVHDRPIPVTVTLARWARSAGAELYYLTGRVEALCPGTLEQLRALDLPQAAPDHLFCKPPPLPDPTGGRPRQRLTGPYKVERLRRLLRRNLDLAWFASDSRVDIHAVQAALPAVPAVWIDFPVKPAQRPPPIRPGTPTLRPVL